MDIEGPDDLAAIAWYARRDYDEIRHLMQDGSALPESYDDWICQAQQRERLVAHGGFRPIRVTIEPTAIAEWCRARHLTIDERARVLFCNARLAALDQRNSPA